MPCRAVFHCLLFYRNYYFRLLNKFVSPETTLVATDEVLEVVEVILLNPVIPNNELTVDDELLLVTNPVAPETRPVVKAVL